MLHLSLKVSVSKNMNKKLILITILGTSLAFGLTAGCGTDSKVQTENINPPSPSYEPEKINLDKCNRDVVIRKAGAYSLSGNLNNHSVIVDTLTGTTTLILKNACVANDNSAAIIGASGDKLIINTKENTINTLFSGCQDKERNGAVFSRIPLTFKGGGSLNITGRYQQGISAVNQEIVFEEGNYSIASPGDGICTEGEISKDLVFNGGTFYIKSFDNGIDSNGKAEFNGADIYVTGSEDGDAGIDTEDGYNVNSGRIISLGSNIEIADEDSRQYTMCFILDSVYEAESKVVLKDSKGKDIIAFEADERFKTLVLSDKELTEDLYSLYINGSAVSIGGHSEFEITQSVNVYGSLKK